MESLAAKHGVDITSWTQVDAATLGCDGTVSIEQSAGALGTTYTKEYREIQGGATYFLRERLERPHRPSCGPGPRHLCQCAG